MRTQQCDGCRRWFHPKHGQRKVCSQKCRLLKRKRYDRARYLRLRNDPAWRAAHNAYSKAYRRKPSDARRAWEKAYLPRRYALEEARTRRVPKEVVLREWGLMT